MLDKIIAIFVTISLLLTPVILADWWTMTREEPQDYYPGWNLICYCADQPINASVLIQTYPNCTMLSKFNAQTQSYQTYFLDGPSSFDFKVTCQIGIFIFIEPQE